MVKYFDIIEKNTTQPWEKGCGVLVYNGSQTTFLDENLQPGTQYYYQAWGWNQTDGIVSNLSSAANTTHSADTDTKADWNSLPTNIGSCGDTTNDRFLARRAGVYEATGGYAPASAITDQKFVNVKVLKNGSTKIVSASQRQSAATSSSIVGVAINPKPVSLTIGDYLEYYFNTEEANKGLLNTDYASSGSNQLGAVTFFAVKEILR